MSAANSPVYEIRPCASFVDRGTVVTQEFISRDGHVLAGYRTLPEAAGFPAWERRGDLVRGFSERALCWFPTADAAAKKETPHAVRLSPEKGADTNDRDTAPPAGTTSV